LAPYYWLGFQRQTERIIGLDTDVGALRAGRISISPLRFERDIATWQVDNQRMSEQLGIAYQSDDELAGAGQDPSIDH